MERSIEQQNRNRNKKNHRKGGKGKGKEEEDDAPQELKDEAARLGCEVWEVEDVKAKLAQEGSDSSEEDT